MKMVGQIVISGTKNSDESVTVFDRLKNFTETLLIQNLNIKKGSITI